KRIEDERQKNNTCDGGRLLLRLIQFALLRGSFSRTTHRRLLDVLRRVSAALDRGRGTFGKKIRARVESNLCGKNSTATAARQWRGPVCHGHGYRCAHFAHSRQ